MIPVGPITVAKAQGGNLRGNVALLGNSGGKAGLCIVAARVTPEP